MGAVQSSDITIDDLKEVLSGLRKRLSTLERNNAEMSKEIANLTVANRENMLCIKTLREQALREKIAHEGRGLSVRQPKSSKSVFVK